MSGEVLAWLFVWSEVQTVKRVCVCSLTQRQHQLHVIFILIKRPECYTTHCTAFCLSVSRILCYLIATQNCSVIENINSLNGLSLTATAKTRFQGLFILCKSNKEWHIK